MQRAPTLRFVDDVVCITVHATSLSGNEVPGLSGNEVPGRPALRIESGGSWNRIALGEASLAWARPSVDWQSLVWIGEGRRDSLALIPPIRSDAREQSSWPAFFARALCRSAGLLSAGAWELGALVQRGRRDQHLPTDRAPHAPFGAYGLLQCVREPSRRLFRWVRYAAPNVFALREASPADSSRVRVWRKHARQRALPPVLLWWVSSMAAYLVLDGHDRVLAASLEEKPIGAVALYNHREAPLDPQWMASATEKHARVFSHADRASLATRVAANQALVASYVPQRRHTSIARHVPDLAARFQREHPLDSLAPEIRAALGAP